MPVIGLGTFLTFDVIPGQKRDHLGEVMRRFWEAGGRVDCPGFVSEQLKALPPFCPTLVTWGAAMRTEAESTVIELLRRGRGLRRVLGWSAHPGDGGRIYYREGRGRGIERAESRETGDHV